MTKIGHPSSASVTTPSCMWRALLALHGYYRRRCDINAADAPRMGTFCERATPTTRPTLARREEIPTPLPDYLDLRGARTLDSSSYMPQGLPFVMLPGSLAHQLRHLSLLSMDILSVRVVQPAVASTLGVYSGLRSTPRSPRPYLRGINGFTIRYADATVNCHDLVEKIEYPFDTKSHSLANLLQRCGRKIFANHAGASSET